MVGKTLFSPTSCCRSWASGAQGSRLLSCKTFEDGFVLFSVKMVLLILRLALAKACLFTQRLLSSSMPKVTIIQITTTKPITIPEIMSYYKYLQCHSTSRCNNILSPLFTDGNNHFCNDKMAYLIIKFICVYKLFYLIKRMLCIATKSNLKMLFRKM